MHQNGIQCLNSMIKLTEFKTAETLFHIATQIAYWMAGALEISSNENSID